MSEWFNGRPIAKGVMCCPGCGKLLAVPLGFKVPELLKCQACTAEWLFIKAPGFWADAATKERIAKVEKEAG